MPPKHKHSDPQSVKSRECLVLADKIDLLGSEMLVPCSLCLLCQARQKDGDPEIICKMDPKYLCCGECVWHGLTACNGSSLSGADCEVPGPPICFSH